MFVVSSDYGGHIFNQWEMSPKKAVHFFKKNGLRTKIEKCVKLEVFCPIMWADFSPLLMRVMSRARAV